jgi:hypothetical protein
MTDLPLYRPIKLLWNFPTVTAGTTWIDCLQSKSVRKQARQIPALLDRCGITTTFSPLTDSLYTQWHEFYTKTMQSLGHDNIATPEWFALKKDAYELFWVCTFYKNDEVVGNSLITQNSAGVITHQFKATSRLELISEQNFSLGTLMELVFLEFAFSHSPTAVTSGSSRNGFGYFNSLGYLTSKLRVGYTPTAIEQQGSDHTLPQRTPTTPTIWFIQQDADTKIVRGQNSGNA